MEEKSFRTRILEKILKVMSQAVLWRQKPFVIGVTGSVGKTTTKDMIAHIVREYKRVWVTQKNYNNEIGVPLTILCVEKNINSFWGIVHVCKKWLWAMGSSQYPEILVVEMGVDRPGDMDYLMSIVQPHISVLTSVSHAHSEFFASVEDIAVEKQKIITQMKENGVAVINMDDQNVASVQKKTDVKIITYGTSESANFYASDIEVCFGQHDLTGLSFKLNYKGKVVPVRLRNVIARHMIYAALSALAVADMLQINIIEAARDITDFVSSPGRMRLLEGKNDVLIIDDTYNASPKALSAAIATLHSAPAHRKIAVLGDMLELGDISQKSHEQVAEEIMESNVKNVFFIGAQMRYAFDRIQKSDKIINIHHFDSSKDAVKYITDYVDQKDVVLVKGSRGMKMEVIVRKMVQDQSQIL